VVPVANSAGVVDTGDKFATGVVDSSDKFVTDAIDNAKKLKSQKAKKPKAKNIVTLFYIFFMKNQQML
jgi:hypothetical protein